MARSFVWLRSGSSLGAFTTLTLAMLLAASCMSATEQDTKIAELEATIASGRLAQAEAMIEALQATPASTPLLPTPTPNTMHAEVSNLTPVRLVKAFDGDSGIAADANGEFEFRLYGIDAPERDDVSRAALETLTTGFGSDLYAEERDVDSYGRRVVVLSTRDGSRSVNVEMVREGYAYAYLDYGELDGIVAAEAEAQANGRGIWAPEVPTVDEYMRNVVELQLSATLTSDSMKQAMRTRIRDLLAQALISDIPYENYLSSNPERWDSAQWSSALQNLRAYWNQQSERAQQIGDSLHAILTAIVRADNPYVGRYADSSATQRIAADELANPVGYTTAGAAERLLELHTTLTFTPTATAVPASTPNPIATPTRTTPPQAAATPSAVELWDQGYAAGYALGADCVSPKPHTSGGPWERGYQTGFNAGQWNECILPQTPTPTPEPVLTSAVEVQFQQEGWYTLLVAGDPVSLDVVFPEGQASTVLGWPIAGSHAEADTVVYESGRWNGVQTDLQQGRCYYVYTWPGSAWFPPSTTPSGWESDCTDAAMMQALKSDGTYTDTEGNTVYVPNFQAHTSYAPEEVWDCFLDRDDSRKDSHGTVLSPCGWTEGIGHVFKWRSRIPLYIEHPGAADSTSEFGRHAVLLGDVIEELKPLLRLNSFYCPGMSYEDCLTRRQPYQDGINLQFVDATGIPCGERSRTDFDGCAGALEHGVYGSTPYWVKGDVSVAMRGKTDRQLRHILLHELLHVLTDIAHAERGIMADWRSAAARTELTDMDKAQLWLYSNPVIESGMSLEEIEQIARYGEWVTPPPQ